jgi:hypothetical protein
MSTNESSDERFDYRAKAELFPGKNIQVRLRVFKYMRFDHAADATLPIRCPRSAQKCPSELVIPEISFSSMRSRKPSGDTQPHSYIRRLGWGFPGREMAASNLVGDRAKIFGRGRWSLRASARLFANERLIGG